MHRSTIPFYTFGQVFSRESQFPFSIFAKMLLRTLQSVFREAYSCLQSPSQEIPSLYRICRKARSSSVRSLSTRSRAVRASISPLPNTHAPRKEPPPPAIPSPRNAPHLTKTEEAKFPPHFFKKPLTCRKTCAIITRSKGKTPL